MNSNKFKYAKYYEKTIPKFFVISIALASQGTILPCIKEITCIKTYNFRMKSGMCKQFF